MKHSTKEQKRLFFFFGQIPLPPPGAGLPATFLQVLSLVRQRTYKGLHLGGLEVNLC